MNNNVSSGYGYGNQQIGGINQGYGVGGIQMTPQQYQQLLYQQQQQQQLQQGQFGYGQRRY
jgi:hypothetical protein